MSWFETTAVDTLNRGGEVGARTPVWTPLLVSAGTLIVGLVGAAAGCAYVLENVFRALA